MYKFEEIKELCEKATPGLVRRGTSGIYDDGTTAFKAMLEVDAKLFAQARQMGLDLLGEIECGAATIEAYKETAERLTRERDAAVRRAEAAEAEKTAIKAEFTCEDRLIGERDAVPDTCEWWEQDGEVAWACSKCDAYWTFIIDGPQENGMKFCPMCGRRITAFHPIEEGGPADDDG